MTAAKRLMVCLLLVSILSAPLLSVRPVFAESAGTTLNVTVGYIESISPTYVQFVDEAQITSEIFTGLLSINQETGAVEPGLAESWSWNLEATEITLTLRSGLKWSDGDDLTAEDAWNGLIRSIASTDAAYNNLLMGIVNAESFRDGNTTADQVGIYVDSPTQLRIQLASPNVLFERILTLSIAYPQPSHLFPDHEADWTEPGIIVSSGPYKISAWEKGVSMTLVANDQYFGAAPLIPSVNIRFDMDADTQWSAYYQGLLDTILVPQDKLAIVESDLYYQGETVEVESNCTFALQFNTDSAPFNNPDVRKAFIAAIDRQGLIDIVLAGNGIARQTFIAPSVFGAVDPTAGVGIPSNDSAAQAYLAAAGYAGGDGFPDVTIQVPDNRTTRARWDYLQMRWQTILGVKVTLEYLPSVAWPQPVKLTGWCADYNDGLNYLKDGVNVFKQFGQLGSWTNATYDGLLDTISSTINPDSRLPFYEAAEEILTETDAVIGPLYTPLSNYLVQDTLDRGNLIIGFSANPWHLWKFKSSATNTYTPGDTQIFTPNQGNTIFSLPAGLFGAETTLFHTIVRPDSLSVGQTGQLAAVSETFSLGTVQPGQTLLGREDPPAQTEQPYTIEMIYAPEQLAIQGVIDETTLAIYAKVGGQWVKQPSMVDIANHKVTAITREINTVFSIFGLVETSTAELNVTVKMLNTIDPTWIELGDEMRVVNGIFSGLLSLNPITGEVEPGLAESWRWNPDGTEITLTLRSGLKWSDGQDLTAWDARNGLIRTIYSIGSAYNESFMTIVNAADLRDGNATEDQVGIFVDSDTQLRIQLNEPMVVFEKILTLPAAYPIPGHLFPEHDADWTEPGVIACSGPYKLAAWEKGVSLTLVANDQYYGPAPFIPTVIVRYNLDGITEWNDYYRGALDTIAVPFEKLATFENDPYYQGEAIRVQNLRTNFLMFNTDAAPFNNLNVRKAFIAAIDRQGFIDSVMAGYGVPAQTLIAPNVIGAVDPSAGVGIPSSESDAQAYLAAAGYPGGVNFPEVTVKVPDIASYHGVWDYLQNQWESVLGVYLTVDYQPANEISWPQPLKYIGWSADYNDGYNFLREGLDMQRYYGNLGSWSNPSYEAAVSSIASTSNNYLKQIYYRAAEEILTETDAVIAPIYNPVTNYLTQDTLDRRNLYVSFGVVPWNLFKVQASQNSLYVPGANQTFIPNKGNTTYSLPADLFSEATTLTQTMVRPEDTSLAQPGQLAGVSETFELSASSSSTTLTSREGPAAQTGQPYTIEILYALEQLELQGVADTSSLAIYAKVDGQWVKQPSVVDAVNHKVTATTQEINTTFIVLGRSSYQVFLPNITR